MPTLPQPLHQQITAAFLKELNGFRRNGYTFDGSNKGLFKGTQQEAFDAYVEGVNDGLLKGFLEIPTGVGKTALFIAIISCYLKATENTANAPRVLIHEPTNDLVNQTALAFADFMPAFTTVIEEEDDHGRRLDYDNSEVHVKAKGAKSNSRVLITTYQGQAADERKAVGNLKTYQPGAYGLVIHDEAHYLTGPRFGQAVDKFSDAIQLGVTATPEYSKDKTVANKLHHRYYHLPITTIQEGGRFIDGAIERGDLCPARPILIKTKFTDQDKLRLTQAKTFFEARKGRPLTNRQLEQLYNQEARNMAIIKAYLTGEHPETGKRYLEMTGMIFAGGITHCGDFITHTERVLNQPAYRDVKKWLAVEGLALIAPIHSAVPKEGVPITLGGKKTLCTKDQIKELHRQGKVLLLISDQELKVGTDFPADEFGADAVDRFSVPDAGQRTGRLLRVDRGNQRYERLPNTNKYSALLNVIDENTHSMYKGTPHYPIHAVEVLHGAEHRPPIRRIAGITRFVPQVHDANLGFAFETNIEVIRDTAKKLREGKKKKLPDKDDGWLALGEAEKLPGGRRSEILQAMHSIAGAYDSEKVGIQAIQYRGRTIHVQQMQSGIQQPVCLCRVDWPKVEKAAGLDPILKLPDKNDDWLSRRDIGTLPGGQRRAIKVAMEEIADKYDSKRAGVQTIEYNDLSIRVCKMQTGFTQTICIAREDWPKVEKMTGVDPILKTPDKGETWLSSTDIERMPGGRRNAIQRTTREIMAAYDSRALGIQTVEYRGRAIRAQKMQTGTTQAICIYRADWPKVEKAAGVGPRQKLPDKDETWLSSADINRISGGQRASMEAAAGSIRGMYDCEALGMQTIEYNGLAIRVQQMHSRGGHQPICIYRPDWPKVEEAAEVESHHVDERLKARRPEKKTITPGGGALKRTGCSRGGADGEG